MAFLKENTAFPPNNWSYWMRKYDEWGAWYSGDPESLVNFYTIVALGNETAQEKFFAGEKRSFAFSDA